MIINLHRFLLFTRRLRLLHQVQITQTHILRHAPAIRQLWQFKHGPLPLNLGQVLSQPKITDQELLRNYVYKDIIWFYIPMYQIIPVNMFERIHQLHEHLKDLLSLHAILTLLDIFVEGDAARIFHLDHDGKLGETGAFFAEVVESAIGGAL